MYIQYEGWCQVVPKCFMNKSLCDLAFDMSSFEHKFPVSRISGISVALRIPASMFQSSSVTFWALSNEKK